MISLAYKRIINDAISTLRFSTEGLNSGSNLFSGGTALPSQSLGQTLYSGSANILDSSPNQFVQASYNLSPGGPFLLTGQSSESLVANGKSIFEVTWSITVSTNKKFSNPKIEAIEFIESSWE